MTEDTRAELESNPEALRREIADTRQDMVQQLDLLRAMLRERFDLRHQIEAHPVVACALVAATGALIFFAVRHRMRTVGVRRELSVWASRRQLRRR